MMFKPFRSEKSAELLCQPGLEYWFKERRTLVDFRRGPLGSHFDAFAAYLKAEGYSRSRATQILRTCCEFNAFLIDRGLTRCKELSESLIDSFLDVSLENVRTASSSYSPQANARGSLKRLFLYLVETRALAPLKPKPVKKPYSWILDPYLRHLRSECELSEVTIHRACVQVSSFLEGLRQRVRRDRFRALQAETVESCIKEYLKSSRENLTALTGTLRRFFRYCVSHKYTRTDFSGLVPTILHYRHASLPKGMEDSALERVLNAIDKDSPAGARDYAIALLMMAYGIRGISAAELLLDDIDWQQSRIRIRARKGGKEVTLPLLEPVGEAIIRYLQHRFAQTPFREVFLSTKAPFQPLSSLAISRIVRRYMKKAGVQMPGAGSRTLRHSWAIRALAHNSPIKSIADVLGHRCIDTTFIYAKVDLKALREVSMPWPKKG
jgi:integrase/recombinase XerD